MLAFSVEQRTGEIGVRLANGARAADVQKLVLRQGMLLVGIGLAIGTVGALLGGRMLESQLFGVEQSDPLTLLVVLALLGGTALLAAAPPAWRRWWRCGTSRPRPLLWVRTCPNAFELRSHQRPDK